MIVLVNKFAHHCLPEKHHRLQHRRTQGVGVKTPIELDISQKFYYLCKGD